jgi:hypothetical protein
MPNINISSGVIQQQLNFSAAYSNPQGLGSSSPINWDGTPANTPNTIDLANGEANPIYPTAVHWKAAVPTTTNILGGKAAAGAGINIGLGAATSLSGFPIDTFGNDITEGVGIPAAKYAVSTQFKPIPGVKYNDFRSRKLAVNTGINENGTIDIKNGGVVTQPANGAFLLAKLSTPGEDKGNFKFSFRNSGYLPATLSPAGAYSLFNLETMFGWGNHDSKNAIRNDFTLQSHIATKWRNNDESGKKDWLPTKNLISKATPFRGDKVNVIDFSKRKLTQAYQWRTPPIEFQDNVFGNFLRDRTSLTGDLIKFYLTGPKLHAGLTDDENATDTDIDDIMVFRAIISSLSDSFNAGWSDVKLIGRADPNYQYSGYSRELNLDFTVYATDRDELKPIWRKLNALAGYTAPEYSADSIALIAPWIRFTVGDLFIQQPAVIKSLGYTYDMDASWEINVEDDPEMMQVPFKVDVNMSLSVLTDELPQKNGKFYSLSKRFDGTTGLSKEGSDSWMSGFHSEKEVRTE